MWYIFYELESSTMVSIGEAQEAKHSPPLPKLWWGPKCLRITQTITSASDSQSNLSQGFYRKSSRKIRVNDSLIFHLKIGWGGKEGDVGWRVPWRRIPCVPLVSVDYILGSPLLGTLTMGHQNTCPENRPWRGQTQRNKTRSQSTITIRPREAHWTGLGGQAQRNKTRSQSIIKIRHGDVHRAGLEGTDTKKQNQISEYYHN